MASITEAFATVFRDYVTDGVPASGENEPAKSEIRAIGPVIESALSTIGIGALVDVVYATKAGLDADLAHAANSVGLVYGDSTDANNDLYVKSGASGSGAWTNTGALHSIIDGLAQPYVDAAVAAAAGAAASGLNNLWKDSHFRALYDALPTIAGTTTTLKLDGQARVLLTAGTVSWDLVSSPFGNPAPLCTEASTDFYISLAELGVRVGQTVTLKAGIVGASGSNFSARLFARASDSGTVTGSGAATALAGTGAYVEGDVAPLTIPAGTTVLMLRVARTSGSGTVAVCALQAVLGALARPMDENRATSFKAVQAAVQAAANGTTANRNAALSSLAFDASKNLINPNDPDVKLGHFIDFSSGVPTANAAYNASGFIPVVPGQTYTVSFGHQRAFYDTRYQYVSGTNDTSNTTGTTFVVPAGCYYMRQGASLAAWGTFQLEAGSTKTSFAAFSRKLKAASVPGNAPDSFNAESIVIEKLTPLDRSKNLFNPDDPDVLPGYYVAYNTGIPAANATYTASGFIPVTAGADYTVSYAHQRAFYTAEKVYISGTNTLAPATFTAPAGAAFVRVTVQAIGVDSFQIEAGTSATAFEPYYAPRIGYGALPPDLETARDRLAAVTTPAGAPLSNPYKPEHLRNCNYRLMKRLLGESAQLVISAAGDSFTHNTSRWIGPFTNYLTAKYGDAGGGWCGFGFATSAGQSEPWTAPNQPAYRQGNARPATYPTTLFGSMTSTYSWTAGASPDLAVVTLSQAGDYITQGMPATPVHNGCDLLFIGTADGQIRWRWGSGSWTTENVQGTVGQLQKISLAAGIPAGAGTLTVEWVAGTVKLCGVNLLSAADGVRVNKLACTGSRVSQWAAAPAVEWERGLGFLGHHCFVYMDGTNSQAAGASGTTWGNDIETVVTRVRSATPGVDVLLATPPENQRGFGISMVTYATEGRDRAQALRACFYDMQDLFGDALDPNEYASDGDLPLFNADDTHPEPLTGGRSLVVGFLKCVELF